jgi:hypothetical protein
LFPEFFLCLCDAVGFFLCKGDTRGFNVGLEIVPPDGEITEGALIGRVFLEDLFNNIIVGRF